MGPGDTVADRFVIESAAGKGGMAMVYKARDRTTGETVALKVMHGAGALVPERFDREADVLAELRHPGIVRYVAHGKVGPAAYIAMEWLEGEDLSRRLARSALDVDDALALATCAARALVVAHAHGVVHRDIKPSNLFLVGGDVRGVKLLDFGIARFEHNQDITATGVVLGTPGYMSPEQVRASKDVGGSADTFSLACVLYRCLAGRPPFVASNMVGVLAKILLEEAPRLCELRDDVPEGLDALAFAMLAKDPRARPDDATVAAELERLQRHAGPLASSKPQIQTSLGGGEQRVCSVVLVGRAIDVGDGPTIVDQEPPTGEESNAPLETLGTIASSHGARLEALVDGSLLVVIQGGAREMAARAARCALAIRARMTGHPMALATGRAEALGRLPIGEVVERAAKLLENVGEGVRIDDATVGLLDARFEISGDAGGLSLRSERSPIEEPRTLLGRRTPCVGRERELGTLQGIFEACVAEPAAHCVLLTGPAGIGKSRVVHELVPKLASTGALVWIGRGDMIGQGSMLGLILPSLQRAAGVQEGEALDVRRRKVAARVARNVPSEIQARVTAFLGEIIGTPFPEGYTPELRLARGDPMLLGDHIRRAWLDFLEAELSEQPVVLVLENLQWGDIATVNLVELALHNVRDKPFFVLAIARPEVRQVFPNLWGTRDVQEMPLEELRPRACERLVRATLGEGPSADLVARMVERAAGNAFYLEEIIRAVGSGLGADALPDTLFAMVQGRLDLIDGDLRRVLRAASVFGQTFWAGGVAALLGAKSTDEALAELERLEMIHRAGEGKFPREPDWSFRHAIVRDAAYAMLTDSDRALGHRLAAEWLERAGEREPVILAEHWERGGAETRAIDWYLAAAEQALGGNDFAGAVERAERGVRCGASGPKLGTLRLVQADAHRWRGEYAKTKECAEQAEKVLPPKSDAWYTALAQIAVAAGSLGNVTALVGATEPLFDESPASPAQIAAWDRVAAHFATAGRLDLAEPLWDALDGVADRFDSPWIHRARALRGLFHADPATYAIHSSAAAEAFERAGDMRNACQQRCNAGDAIKELGDHRTAQAMLEKTLVEADRMGLTYVTTNAKLNLSVVTMRTGNGARALELATEAVSEGRGQHHPRFEGAARINLAMAHMSTGDLGGALREIKRAVEFVRASVPPWIPAALASRASIELALGNATDALACAREAMDRLSALGSIEEGEALVRLMWAEALEANGDRREARTAIGEARKALIERAERISDAHYRKTFLEGIQEHARTLDLARLWADQPSQPTT